MTKSPNFTKPKVQIVEVKSREEAVAAIRDTPSGSGLFFR